MGFVALLQPSLVGLVLGWALHLLMLIPVFQLANLLNRRAVLWVALALIFSPLALFLAVATPEPGSTAKDVRPRTISGAVSVLVFAGVVAGFLIANRKGDLVVTTSGAGGTKLGPVDVLIDEKLVCTASPCEVKELSRGQHQVVVRATGFAEVPPEPIYIKGGDRVLTSIELSPLLGAPVWVSAVNGAFPLSVDDKVVGLLPMKVTGLSVGQHVFRIAATERNAMWERRLTVKPDEQQSLDATPKILKGVARIESGRNADGAKVVLVQGDERRPIPTMPVLIDIPTDQKYQLVATKQGHEDFAVDLDFPDGSPERTFWIDLVPRPN
jgi:hypothetical protein